MGWQKRLVDLKTAIGKIPPGRRIQIASGAAVPSSLVQGLVDHGWSIC